MAKAAPKPGIAPKSDIILPDAYLSLKKKIIAGEVTKEDAAELYKSFEAVPRADQGKAIDASLSDLGKDISPENFHKFVGTLLEVEKDVVNEKHPGEGEEATKKRGADYVRNVSLARRAFIMECMKTGLGREVYDAFTKGDRQKMLDAMISVKIPDQIKEHYSKIIEPFYRENGDPLGASVNLVFHGLYSAIPSYAPDREKQAKLLTAFNPISKLAYEKTATTNPQAYKESFAAIQGQITGQPISEAEVEKLKAQAKERAAKQGVSLAALPQPAPVKAKEAEQAKPSIGQKIKLLWQKAVDKVNKFGRSIKETFSPSTAKPTQAVTTPAATRPINERPAPPAERSSPELRAPATPRVAQNKAKNKDQGQAR